MSKSGHWIRKLRSSLVSIAKLVSGSDERGVPVMQHPFSRQIRLSSSGIAAILSLCSLSIMMLSACGGSTSSTQNSNAPITVWVDAGRMTAVDAYKKAFPADASKINAVIVDRTQFPAKVVRQNSSNSGWPDVVLAEPDLVA